MKKSTKIITGIICSIVILFLAFSIGIGNYLVNYAIMKSGDGGNREVALDIEAATDEIQKTIQENRIEQKKQTAEFLERVPETETEILSTDNLKLKGFYFENPEAENWVISIHGYRDTHKSMRIFAHHFYDAGYNVLLPELRACGTSEGNFIGMGWLDKNDILLWINWILKKSPEAKIIIHGVSMGGATTMMVSGENTPDNVICFIDDCGYTSVWDIFSSELKLRFHLPSFPVLNSASFFAKLRAKYSFSEASSLKQVKKCDKPMLFIHGTSDNFIHYDMMETLYEAKKGSNKQKLPAPGAGHGEAVYALDEVYFDTVLNFIKSSEK